jgi:hypothetical protein
MIGAAPHVLPGLGGNRCACYNENGEKEVASSFHAPILKQSSYRRKQERRQDSPKSGLLIVTLEEFAEQVINL